MNKVRMQILDGKLEMPKIKGFKNNYGTRVNNEIERMFNAMWKAFLSKEEKGTISLPYWAKRIANPEAMNIALKLLSQSGWITSKSLPTNNWGEAYLRKEKLLKYVSEDELAYVRKYNKFKRYVLSLEPEATKNNIVRVLGEKTQNGIIREGFRKTGNTVFSFDVDNIVKHYDDVLRLINKGIDKTLVKYKQLQEDGANYAEVGKEALDYYIYNDENLYSSGQANSDSRGRNIAGMLNKIGNPIGFKIMRAMLIIPEEYRNIATKKGLKNKYLFIAELLGYKNGTISSKVQFGRKAYYTNKLNNSNDIDDLYEDIWLQRMYKELDEVFELDWKGVAKKVAYANGTIGLKEAQKHIEKLNGKTKWYIPVEIDMSASVLGIMGLLLNHKPFLERTNMIGNKIQDAWNHDVVTNRIQFKTIMRIVYGSSMSPDQMWSEMNIKYTMNEVVAFKRELEVGDIAVANRFKDFIIQNVKPKKEMTLKVGNENFTVPCNRYYNVGERTYKFDLYDSYTNSIRRIHNTETVKKPDLTAFKRFFVTGLIHNLDSQVMNNTVDKVIDMYDWAIDIHDAIILDAEAVEYAKEVFIGGTSKDEPSLNWISRNRKEILGKYFTSIGITNVKAWNENVKPYIEEYEKEVHVNKSVLK